MMWAGVSPASWMTDELAEIGLHRLDSGGFEGLVEADLLGRHRLRLDRLPRSVALAQLDDDPPCLGGVGGPVDPAAGRLDRVGEPGEVGVELAQGVGLDLARQIAQSFAFRIGREGGGAGRLEAFRRAAEGVLEVRVAEGLAHAVGEAIGGHLHGRAVSSALSARISAT